MAAGDYRYRLPGGIGNMPQASATGHVNFDVFVEVCTEDDPEEVWELIPGGHFTQPVPGPELEACGTGSQALAVVAGYILEKGLTQADRAQRALIALLPSGQWPVDDITQPLAW